MLDGWFEGQGQAPTDEGLDWLAQTFAQHYPEDLPLPFLYPTVEGKIQAEWPFGPTEITLIIDLKDHTGEWQVWNVATGEKECCRGVDLDAAQVWQDGLDLESAQAWQWIIKEIRLLYPDTKEAP